MLLSRFFGVVCTLSFVVPAFSTIDKANEKKKAHASVLTAKMEGLSDLFRYPAIVDSNILGATHAFTGRGEDPPANSRSITRSF